MALIGRQWATVTDENGDRRLDNPDDYVRFEVQAALDRGVRVIPVLVDGATPLQPQHLPVDLQRLARLNALELSYGRYEYDADRLVRAIDRVLAAQSERTVQLEPEELARQAEEVRRRQEAEEEARQAEAEARRREEEARQAEQERQRAEAEARRAAEEAERKEAARARQEAKAQRRAAREADRGGRREPAPAEPPCRAENLLAQSRHATVKDAAEFAAGVVNGHPQPDDVLEELLSRLAASAQLSGRGKRACRAALVVLTRKDGPSPAELAAALAPAGNGPVAVPA